MVYPYLVVAFFLSLLFGFVFVFLVVWRPKIYREKKKVIWWASGFWFVPYIEFTLLLTGPQVSLYPPSSSSPFKLPWDRGTARLVIQGSRGFTTHRDLHLYAWDFLMPNGTPILAARDGVVEEVVDSFDGVGLPVSFSDFEPGIPLAGHFYQSLKARLAR